MKVNCWGHNFTVCAVYRPPNASSSYLQVLHDELCMYKDNQLILSGDFNLPQIDWLNPKSVFDAVTNPLLDVMLMCDLVQTVLDYTRVAGNARSILDLVFVNSSTLEHRVSINSGISDHMSVLLSFPLGSVKEHRKQVNKTVKNYSNADDQSILDTLWNFCDNLPSSVAILWNTLKSTVHFCIDSYIPSRSVRTNQNNPWISREIIHLHRRLKRAKRRHSPPSKLNSLKTLLASKLSDAKTKYFSQTLPSFIKSCPEKFWRYLGDRPKDLQQISINGYVTCDSVAIANHFNQYFHSVFSPIQESTPYNTPLPNLSSEFITVEGVINMLLNLKIRSSVGPDNIPNAFLHRYAEPLGHILTHLFRLSFDCIEIPDDWRMACVVPIFKKGDRLFADNYRPISLTSSICKLFEHVVSNFIVSFLEANNILTPFQHGFRKRLSTLTQLVTTIHELASSLDKAEQIDVIFLDFSKAFDRVPHSKLILKLQKIGLPITLIKWIQCYLSNRKQFVKINSCFSTTLPVTSGVPQGSVLGPVLFLIYINDISDVIDASSIGLKLFADDCVLFKRISSSSDQANLQSNLDAVSEWCAKWSMELNCDKSVLLQVTNKKNAFTSSYRLNNHTLKQVDEYKYLGVTITSRLTWSSHINKICASASRKLGFLRHKLKTAPSHVKLLAYNSIVRPQLEYASAAWDPFLKKDIHKLEMVQRRAVRFIFNSYHSRASLSLLMANNNIMTLENRRKLARLRFLFLLSSQQFNVNPALYIQPRLSRSTRTTHEHNLTPIFARTNLFKHSFFPRTIEQWNRLPVDVFSARDVSDFEKRVLSAIF